MLRGTKCSILFVRGPSSLVSGVHGVPFEVPFHISGQYDVPSWTPDPLPNVALEMALGLHQGHLGELKGTVHLLLGIQLQGSQSDHYRLCQRSYSKLVPAPLSGGVPEHGYPGP